MSEPMPKCEWHDCGAPAEYVVEGRAGEPLLARYPEQTVWSCHRCTRVLRLLAESYGRTLTVTARWRVTAESLMPPF